ncbi:unnamed protein product, partial [Closterium sp. NIES-53]
PSHRCKRSTTASSNACGGRGQGGEGQGGPVATVGIHIRVGDDVVWAGDRGKPKELTAKQVDWLVTHARKWIHCARRVEEFWFPSSVAVRWMLITNSAQLKAAIKSRFPSKVITTDFIPRHSNSLTSGSAGSIGRGSSPLRLRKLARQWQEEQDRLFQELPCAASPCPARFPSARAPPCLRAALLVARHPALPAMASLSVLTFDHEGRPIQFDKWLGDLQLYLLSDYRDRVSLFDITSGASLAPPTTADSATRSQWLTCDAAARLAVRNHLPLAEHAHFGQHKTTKALYDAVVARYSSPATAALDRLILPCLFPELSTFATVEDLITHLRTSDTHYCAALPAEFLDRNPPDVHHSHFIGQETRSSTVAKADSSGNR